MNESHDGATCLTLASSPEIISLVLFQRWISRQTFLIFLYFLSQFSSSSSSSIQSTHHPSRGSFLSPLIIKNWLCKSCDEFRRNEKRNVWYTPWPERLLGKMSVF